MSRKRRFGSFSTQRASNWRIVAGVVAGIAVQSAIEYLRDILANIDHDLGPVTARLPGAEARPGQQRMADLVATAIAERRHLVVQAGTGTGKTLAYLVPAIASGARVVVATGVGDPDLWSDSFGAIEVFNDSDF